VGRSRDPLRQQQLQLGDWLQLGAGGCKRRRRQLQLEGGGARRGGSKRGGGRLVGEPFVSGYIAPSPYELGEPMLQKAVKMTSTLREDHERA
jgi:hypothetical protein